MNLASHNVIEIGMEAELEKLVHAGKLKNRQIFVMGSLNNMHRVNLALQKYGFEIAGGLDNNTDRHGRQFLDGKEYILTSPDILLNKKKSEYCVLIFSIRFWGEMRDQLHSMGLKNDKEIFILEAPILRKKIKYILKGYRIYKEIKRKFGEDKYIFLFHGPVGDNYLFGLFNKQFIEGKGIQDHVWAGTGATEKISQIYGNDLFLKLNREEIVALEFLYMFLGDGAIKLKILQIWEFEFHFNRCRIRFDERFTFTDTYRSYVYDLPEDIKINPPVFKCDEVKMKATFLEKGLIPGRTVVLAPYAYSIEKRPPESFWISLAEQLKAQGFSICINIIPGVEKNFIPDAAIMEFDLYESVKYLEYAGSFIGMRSGLCDVISSAGCNKVILYPVRADKRIDYDRHRSDMDFGGLNNMGLCDDAIEVEFNFDNYNSEQYWGELCNEISSYIKYQ